MKNIVYTITIIFSLLSKTIAQTDTLHYNGNQQSIMGPQDKELF